MIRASDLTVVVPTYRRPLLLAQALQSVLDQRLPGLRIGVFDNASNDETAAVVAAVDARQPVDYLRRPENIGAVANIDGALASVRTPYFAMLADDDLQLPGFLEGALAELARHPSAAAYCGRTVVYDDLARQVYRVQGSGWEPGLYRAGMATRRMVDEHFTWTGVVFKTEVLEKLPRTGGDMEFMAALADGDDFVVAAQLTAVWRLHQGSWTRDHSIDAERALAMTRLQSYLALRTLTPGDRYATMLRTTRELAHRSFQGALEAVVAGNRDAEVRRELAASARLLTSIDGSDGPIREALYRAAQLLAGGGRWWRLSAPLLHAVASVTSRAARVVHPPRPPSAAERAALDYIADVERRVQAWLPQGQPRTT